MRAPAFPVAFFLILIAALSCKKDGSFPLEPSSVYNKKGMSNTSPARVFAKSGEITTASIVNRFKAADEFYFGSMSDQLFRYQGRVDTIKVQTGQVVAITENFHVRLYNATQKGGNIMLTAKDTTMGMSYNEVYTRTLPYHIVRYKPPVFRETLVTSTRGFYGFEYTTLTQFHLETEDSRIIMPWILGIIHNGSASISTVILQNKIDFSFHKNLPAGDTVVVQEYAVWYEK